MHDIDLIPTEVVARLRDEKRKVRWSKLTKDAAAKVVATKGATRNCYGKRRVRRSRRERHAQSGHDVLYTDRDKSVLGAVNGRVPAMLGRDLPAARIRLAGAVDVLLRVRDKDALATGRHDEVKSTGDNSGC